ncbi:MAG: HAD family hydrolase [Planctomycetota bacterium]|nr:HAD family hydrolase [Planctomycetota bacterium]
MVREFQRAFDHPVATRPGMLKAERAGNRAGWLQEEVHEFIHATSLEEQVDAIIDLMYFALGTMVELGVDAAPIFELVHRANMSKLWPDGKPRLRTDGKVQKPAAWVAPEGLVAKEIERQARQCHQTPRATETLKTGAR